MSNSAALTFAQGTSALASIGGAYGQAQSIKAQGIYAEGISNINAGMAEILATDSIERGEFAASEIKRKSERDLSAIRQRVKQVKGSQRVAYAAQGIDTVSGSAADVMAETRFLGAKDQIDLERDAKMDMLTVRNNAWREAWGYRAGATLSSVKGRMARTAADNTAKNTLLTGILTGASSASFAFASLK